MSENYYKRGYRSNDSPEYHVGKTSSRKGGMIFIWATDPESLKDLEAVNCPCCHREYGDRDNVIENEYGELFTLEKFNRVLKECKEQDKTMIGQAFC